MLTAACGLQRYTSSCQPNPARLNGQHPARNEVASRRPAANVPNNGQTLRPACTQCHIPPAPRDCCSQGAAQSSIQAVDEIVTCVQGHCHESLCPSLTCTGSTDAPKKTLTTLCVRAADCHSHSMQAVPVHSAAFNRTKSFGVHFQRTPANRPGEFM